MCEDFVSVFKFFFFLLMCSNVIFKHFLLKSEKFGTCFKKVLNQVLSYNPGLDSQSYLLLHFRASYRYENTLVDKSKRKYYPNYFIKLIHINFVCSLRDYKELNTR